MSLEYLNYDSVQNMTDDDNVLLIQGDASEACKDVVNASGCWTQGVRP